MRRRQFLGVLGGAALWPFAARSQGMTAPVIGFLSPSSNSAAYTEGFFVGVRELGYVDGRNIRIESLDKEKLGIGVRAKDAESAKK